MQPYSDPDIAYNQLIRPRKNKLALFYIQNGTLSLDITLIVLTFIAIVNKRFSLKVLVRILRNMEAGDEIINIVRRNSKLTPMPPPGSQEIVYSRE